MTWDDYYLNMCHAVAKNSKCLSRQIGAIIVKDKALMSTGYNGAPKQIPHCGRERYNKDKKLADRINKEIDKVYDETERQIYYTEIWTTCPRQILGYKSGEGLDICTASHAERSALINAARYGIAVDGCKMYMDCPVPCGDCMKEIINAGIVEVICTKFTYYDEMSKFLIENSDIRIRTFDEKSL